jgi:uncharacterized MAPEG superfamily protein
LSDFPAIETTCMNFSTPTILLTSIAAAAFSIYFPYLFVAKARFEAGFDMSAPRALFDRLPDYGKRATWAHQNSFETCGIYSVAALMAYVSQVESPLAASCAIAFVAARFLFSIFYITDIPIGRSLMFGVGSLSTFTLMFLSITNSLK